MQESDKGNDHDMWVTDSVAYDADTAHSPREQGFGFWVANAIDHLLIYGVNPTDYG